MDAVEAGDRVASEISWSAVHTGPLATPAGEIPPTGARVTWAMCMVDRFDGDRIASRHVYFDGAEFAGQLLAEPAAAPAGA